jgi:hypothetical protein
VMDTAPVLPYCHSVTVVAPVWALQKLVDRQIVRRRAGNRWPHQKWTFIAKYNSKLNMPPQRKYMHRTAPVPVVPRIMHELIIE